MYVLFEDFTHLKFYRLSLRASVELFEGRPFEDGFRMSTAGFRSV